MASTIAALTSGAGGISMTGDASGILNLNSNGTNVVAVSSTGVAVTGTLTATGAITGSSTVAGSTGILYPLTSGTAVASTSGTSIDFTSIPSWVKRITVMLNGVSTNGTAIPMVQLGAGSVDATSYTAMAGAINTTNNTTRGNTNSTGFIVSGANTTASDIHSGFITFSLLGSNVWTVSGNVYNPTGPNTSSICGVKTLSGTLDRIRLTTVNGTDTFDAGSINILYE
jgi:hypothetical protein